MQFDPKGWLVLSQPGQLRDFLREHVGKPFHVIYSPAPMSDNEEHFEYVVRLARAAEDMVLYIDEVDQLCSPAAMMAPRSRYWSLPENQKRIPAFQHLIDSGRHAGIALVMISRVPAQVNRKVTSNAQEMRIFRQNEPNVLAYFRGMSAQVATLLPTLQDFEYVLWQDGKDPVIAGGRR